MTIATLLHIAEKKSKYTEIQKLILGITYEVGANLFRTIHRISNKRYPLGVTDKSIKLLIKMLLKGEILSVSIMSVGRL